MKSQNHIISKNNEEFKINQYLTKVSTELIDNYNKTTLDLGMRNNVKYEQMLFNQIGIIKEEIQEIILAFQLTKKE